MYKKLELIIGFIFLNNIFRHMQIFQKILKKRKWQNHQDQPVLLKSEWKEEFFFITNIGAK